LRSQLQIVFEATRQTAEASVGTVVPADFIYDQISTDLLNSGELEREYDEIIRKQRDGTKDGDLRSSLCALVFLIGKLPRTPGADDGVRREPNVTKAALYARVSTDKQREEATIESQIVELKKQIAAAGHTLVKEYIDDGHSGAYLDRPALDELRAALKTDIFDAVYFHCADRIARDAILQNIIISELLKHKKRIIIKRQGLRRKSGKQVCSYRARSSCRVRARKDQ
jgi:hypothetical protein